MNYGYRPSTKRFSRQHTFSATPVPDVIDLSAYKPQVINQGQVGRCTGCGTGGIISGHLSQLGANPTNAFIVSPDDLYNLGRDKEGTLDKDAGAEPYDVLTMAQEYGVVPYVDWPLSSSLDTETPTSAKREAEAIKYPGFTPYQINTSSQDTALTNILDAMAAGHFINIGTWWFSAWENYDSGLLPMQTAKDTVAGGHDTFLFGADTKNRFFWGQNSWGTSQFGSKNKYPGCYMLPFDMIPVMVGSGLMEAEYVTFKAAVTPTPTPTPSTCKWGNGVAATLNLYSRLARRRGRFYYLNKE